jgi:hypothetical protein
LIGNNFSRIPEVGLAGFESGGGRGGTDLISGLHFTHSVRNKFPRKARLFSADADGILQMFAGESVEADGGKILRVERFDQEKRSENGK